MIGESAAHIPCRFGRFGVALPHGPADEDGGEDSPDLFDIPADCLPVDDTLPGFDEACPPSHSAAEHGLRASALHGLRCVKQAFPAISSMGGRRAASSPTCSFSDHCTGLAVDFMIPRWNTRAGNSYGWRVAHWVQTHAKALRVKYIIFDARKWVPTVSSAWRPYRHPYGNTNPTLAHRNHVHVSFYTH